VTVNNAIYEVTVAKGGGETSLSGDYTKAISSKINVEFPASLLKKGYNEIALRSTTGSWIIFDALNLETPQGAKLAPASKTIVRAVSTLPYDISGNNQATFKVEVYQHEKPGKLNVTIGSSAAHGWPLDPGFQVLEIPTSVPADGKSTKISFTAEGKQIAQSTLQLKKTPKVTPADYVDLFKGTAHSRWMIAPGPWMPFGMVKISPDNQNDGWLGGYEYTNEYIDCFSHIHEWTMGGLGMMPTIGELRNKPGLDGKG
jgi:hypothetical protein